jgi:tRNA pseudouridine55 synthase
MKGILLVDKPEGWTSHDVVAKVRGILCQQVNSEQFTVHRDLKTKNYQLRTPKVGHTGTLDPAATGLLILVVGNYTKRAGEFSKLDKVYEAELTLGATSRTGDKEGEITKVNGNKPEKAAVKAVLAQFKGEILQRPHMYSAVKIDGQRAYKAARAGKTVEIEPRKVKIYEITDVDYDYPKLKFTAKVSSGTYIRSLAEDIGEKLGTGAYLSSLRRLKVGDYTLEQAVSIDKIANNDIINLVIQTPPNN